MTFLPGVSFILLPGKKITSARDARVTRAFFKRQARLACLAFTPLFFACPFYIGLEFILLNVDIEQEDSK
jgi:hypothetical protein